MVTTGLGQKLVLFPFKLHSSTLEKSVISNLSLNICKLNIFMEILQHIYIV